MQGKSLTYEKLKGILASKTVPPHFFRGWETRFKLKPVITESRGKVLDSVGLLLKLRKSLEPPDYKLYYPCRVVYDINYYCFLVLYEDGFKIVKTFSSGNLPFCDSTIIYTTIHTTE